MLDVLYEDNHLLAVNKSAMLPTMGVLTDRDSLITDAKAYVRDKYQKPGNVFLGVVSRLDTPVTGIVLLARTSKAAARLSRQFRDREVQKIYWAMVDGVPTAEEQACCHWLRKDERHRRVVITPHREGAQEARLRYRVLCTLREDAALLEVQLETGRKHQIRVQLAGVGHSILGDRKYGNHQPFSQGIALHSRRLVLMHPVRNERLELQAPLPPSWRKFLPNGFGMR